jgi:hypothetical protein
MGRTDGRYAIASERPTRAPVAPGGELGRVSTPVLARAVLGSFPRMPRREMQELLRRGAAVIPELTAAVRTAGRQAGDALWGVVVLGELRHPDAIDALGRLLGRRDSLGVAAAEALGKIGGPAVSFLSAVAARAGVTRRLRAYGALGMIRTEEAYDCLRTALRRDRELSDVIAWALAQHGRREAISALWQASRRVPGWMRRELESAIASLAHGAPAPDPVDLDWRVRYRRLPRLAWGVAPSWISLAGLLRVRRARRPDDGAPPPRPLDEIVADAGLLPGGQPCPACGGSYWRPTGLPVCRHSARAVIALQRLALEHWIERGVLDVWTALDACDAADMRLEPDDDAHADGADLAALGRATLYWLVAIDCEDLRTGMHHLCMISDDFPATPRKPVAAADSRRRARMTGAAPNLAPAVRERRSPPSNFS